MSCLVLKLLVLKRGSQAAAKRRKGGYFPDLYGGHHLNCLVRRACRHCGIIAMEPDLLILDEPTAVNPQGRELILFTDFRKTCGGIDYANGVRCPICR